MITVQKGWHNTPVNVAHPIRWSTISSLRERIQIEIFPSINRETSFRDLLKSMFFFFFFFFFLYRLFRCLQNLVQKLLRFLSEFIDRRRYEMARYRFYSSIYFNSVRKFRQGDNGSQLAKGIRRPKTLLNFGITSVAQRGRRERHIRLA